MQNKGDPPSTDPSYNVVYLGHLGAVSDRQEVVTTEDIYNQFGLLLVPKGTRINQRIAQGVQRHKLEKPIDEQVNLESCLTNNDIYRDVVAFVETHDELLELHKKCDFDEELRHLCLSEYIPFLLLQKLSVMAECLPDLYKSSLLVAWLSGLIAKELGLLLPQRHNIFVCGLFHDIGLLHIPEQVLNDSPLSEEHFRALQSHAVYGSLIVEGLRVYPPAVARGILEHHERLDRTGYPAKKEESQLGLIGQIVGSADFMYHLFSNELKAHELPLSACRHYLKIHQREFKQEVYSAMFSILNRLEVKPATLDDANLSQLHKRILDTNQQLSELAQHLPALLELEPSITHSSSSQSIMNVCRSLLDTLNRSGLDFADFKLWLSEMRGQDDYEMLLEMDVTQYELLWLFKRLGWSLETYLNQQSSLAAEVEQQLQAFIVQLQKMLSSAWSRYTS